MHELEKEKEKEGEESMSGEEKDEEERSKKIRGETEKSVFRSKVTIYTTLSLSLCPLSQIHTNLLWGALLFKGTWIFKLKLSLG